MPKLKNSNEIFWVIFKQSELHALTYCSTFLKVGRNTLLTESIVCILYVFVLYWNILIRVLSSPFHKDPRRWKTWQKIEWAPEHEEQDIFQTCLNVLLKQKSKCWLSKQKHQDFWKCIQIYALFTRSTNCGSLCSPEGFSRKLGFSM